MMIWGGGHSELWAEGGGLPHSYLHPRIFRVCQFLYPSTIFNSEVNFIFFRSSLRSV